MEIRKGVGVESTIDTHRLEADVQFEQHYAQVLAFVKKQKHASCFELQKEFHIRYVDAVHLMDTLDARDIVDIAAGTETGKGPLPLLTEKGRTLKRERQQREREEKKREAEKPKVEPSPQVSVAPAAPLPVREVRKRAKLRKS